MLTVVGVKFKRIGKVYYFDPAGLEYHEGDHVIVETARGIEYGELAFLPKEVPEEQVVQPLKKVIRIATERDEARVVSNEEKEKRAMDIAEQLIRKLGLEMKLVNVECTFDGSRIVFYFTADGRVDFRELIKELAQRFHTRIELKQIGVRDETKMMGGLGPCGREICCTSFMSDFHPVSIRMAKEQNISLNPTKISGLCGRLMCCLKFEYDQYRESAQMLPRVGTDVVTPDGPGVSVENDLLQRRVKVRVTLPDHSLDLRNYPLEELRVMTEEEREDAYLHPERYFTARIATVDEEEAAEADDMLMPLRIRGHLVEDKPLSSQENGAEDSPEAGEGPAPAPRPNRRGGRRRRRPSQNQGGTQRADQPQPPAAREARPAGNVEGGGRKPGRSRRRRPRSRNGQSRPEGKAPAPPKE